MNYQDRKYKYLNNKIQTHNVSVKGVNSDIIEYFPYLQRKSKCFTKMF